MAAHRKIPIIAMSNGAHRMTFATEFRLSLVAFRVGRPMNETIHEYAAKCGSLAFETTLRVRDHVQSIPFWRKRSFRVKLLFQQLATLDMAVSYVRQRVSESRHDEQEVIVRRRLHAG